MNRYFWPDVSATSQILTDLARVLSGQRPVSVVASRQLSGDPRTHLAPHETIDGIRLARIRTTRLGRHSLWRRAVDYLSFHGAVVFHLLRHVGRGDLVVLKTDPPLLQLVNTSVVRLRGGRVINWLQDVYPEVAVRLGKFPAPRFVADLVARWRDRALRAASVNVVVSEAMAEYLRKRGVENAWVIPNWADGSEIVPIEHERNPLRAEWGLRDEFTVMYSGNFGRAHSFAEIAEAVRLLASENGIRFMFVGDGAGLDPLKAQLALAGTNNFAFHPFQPRERLKFSLPAADLHLVTIKPEMEDLLMPSKLYGILAAGRPVAFVGDPDGDIASLIRRENLGVVIPAGGSKLLAESILRLRTDADLRARQSTNARQVFEASFTRECAANAWQRLLAAVEACGAVLPKAGAHR